MHVYLFVLFSLSSPWGSWSLQRRSNFSIWRGHSSKNSSDRQASPQNYMVRELDSKFYLGNIYRKFYWHFSPLGFLTMSQSVTVKMLLLKLLKHWLVWELGQQSVGIVENLGNRCFGHCIIYCLRWDGRQSIIDDAYLQYVYRVQIVKIGLLQNNQMILHFLTLSEIECSQHIMIRHDEGYSLYVAALSFLVTCWILILPQALASRSAQCTDSPYQDGHPLTLFLYSRQ